MKLKLNFKISSAQRILLLGVFLMSSLSIFNACKKSETSDADERSIKDEKMVLALKKAYGLTDFDLTATKVQKDQIISSAKNDSRYFNTISKNLDLNIIKLFTNIDDNVTVAIFSYKNDKNRSFAVKGTFAGGKFYFSDDLFVEKSLQKDVTSFIIGKGSELLSLNFSKEGENIQGINLGDGKPNLLDLNTQLRSNQIMGLNPNITSFYNDKYGNHGGNGFCQRERGEKFSDCYKAEKDEFCDGFFSCLAVDTSPAVMLLIASACSCQAKQSD